MGARAWSKRHPDWAYFVLTFAISWGGLLVLAMPYGMPAKQDSFTKAWPVVFLPYLMGPLLSGLVLTGIVHGAPGYKRLGARLVHWRLAPRYYAVALLTAPVLILLTLLPLSILSSSFAPAIISKSDRFAVLAMGLGVGILGGGLLEEPGWTGFATPEMRRHLSPLSTGVTLGMIWGAWHLLPTYWGSGNADGAFDPWLFVPPCVFYLGVLPAYRTLIVLMHEVTGSLLIAVLQHASLTACSLFILAPPATGAQLAGYYVILSALMWATVLLMRRTWLAPSADGASHELNASGPTKAST